MTTLDQSNDVADTAVDLRMRTFRAKLEEMRVPGSRPQADRVASLLAVLAMTVGVLLAVVAYVMSHGSTNPLEQNDAIVLAILAATIELLGVGLFVKKGQERLLRFWMARMTFEQGIQTDRLLAQGEQLRDILDGQRDSSTVA